MRYILRSDKDFLTFLKGLGINVGYKEELETKDYQSILNRAKNNSAFSVINRVMLRSMQKAKYSPIQKGHFGLGEFDYLHFTSPIRRYPDLFVHRVIKDFMDKGKDFVYKKYSSVTKNVANRSSEMERNVMEAERAVDDYFKMLYISDFVGEEFEGVISGVTSFGLFVELANGIEGLVKLETLDGDDYQFDNQNYLLANKKNKYRLGQNVLIKVAGINQTEKRAEFILIKNLQNNS